MSGKSPREKAPSRQFSQQQHKQLQPHFVDAPSTTGDIVLGVLTQVARKYLFIDPKKRVYVYLAATLVLSVISEFNVLPDHYYLVQKHNFINRYLTKLGWLWTCLPLVPFIWLTSLLHHGSRQKAFRDLSRLAIATAQWYIWTKGFIYIEHWTGLCHGAKDLWRHECHDGGGKWIPGLDISGHTFMLIYAALLIGEEVSSFRNWPTEPRRSTVHGAGGGDHVNTIFFLRYQNFRTTTRIIQGLFLTMSILHLIWDMQLVITLLYYHTLSHKLLGALIGVFVWAMTYRFWYPMAFPFSPIRRHTKVFDGKIN